MRTRSLCTRIIASTLLLVSGTCAVFGVFTWLYFSGRTHHEAQHEANTQRQEVQERLASIDTLSGQQVDNGMKLLAREAALKGAPTVRGTASVSGKTVPNLYFGGQSQVENFEIVDRIHALVGGTATLFVWDGQNFIRASTNVKKEDGTRALGTVLDPNGKAYAALASGSSFKGVVKILGAPYTTRYEPLKDDAGKLVGALYTGYRLDSIAALSSSIASADILDHGFLALIDPSGAVIAHGDNITLEKLAALRKNPSGWVLQEERYPAWDYRILTAYPQTDVLVRVVKTLAVLTAETVLLVGLILGLLLTLLQRQVIQPANDLASLMNNADLNTVVKPASEDEIGALAASFNEFVQRLRTTLLDVQARAQDTHAKSNEIQSIAHEAVAGLTTQTQQANEASALVTQLSRDIASTSGHTDNASEQARAAAEAARQGSQLVETTAAKMQQLAADTQESSTQVAALSDRVKEIGSIVGVIEEIAAGTNLLALNASIEAARAGEHGRGFAVVAGEVRRLAERTAQATQQVSGLVSGIQNETSHAASDISEACTHAGEGADAVQSLSETFKQISELVFSVDDKIAQIAQSARQEADSADAAMNTMHQVASSADENARGAEHVVAASTQLIETGNQLKQLVQQFRVEE
jgi:methyl-accepting chemotaxis protein